MSACVTTRGRSWLAAVALAVVLIPAEGLAAQQRRMELADIGREVGLATPRLSPDGRQVVLVRTRTNYRDNRFEQSLVVVDVASGALRELTPGRTRVSSPAWSPGGDRIAFLDSGEDRPAQLFVLPTGGGEARQLTDGKSGIDGFAWSPDGATFVIRRTDEPAERTGEEKHNRSFEVGDNVYLAQSAPLPVHPWLVPAAGGEPTRLRSGAESTVDAGWTPDGKLLLAIKPLPHSGVRERKIVVLDVVTRTEKVLLGEYALWAPGQLSPNGRWLAIGHSPGPELGFRSMGVSVLPIAGGAARVVTTGLDRSIGSATWLPQSDGLVLTGPDHTRIAMWMQPLDGPARRVDLGDVDPVSPVDVSRTGAIAFIGETPHQPGELYVMPGPDATPRRLTHLNAGHADLELGRVERMDWQGPDGFRENGVLIYPPGYRDGQRYPLVLHIHGGPMSTSTEGWSAFPHLLAAQGWLVFQPNYRGSTNMGDAFQRAVINDAGEGPGRDVMAGVTAIKDRGIVADDRVAVSGWSYGGYMTAWLTSHFTGWRAAVAGAAVTDWFDWYSMADMNTWAGFGLGGSPWLNDNALNYWRQSPMAYAHRIRTPTLILSTTGDPRVTVSQSYKLYHALKDNGTEVQFIAYPTGGHFPPDPVHQRDVYRRWLEWIQRRFEVETRTGAP